MTKSALEEVPPWLLALMRFGVASAILLPLAQLRGGPSLLPKPVPIGTLVFMGATGVTLMFLCAYLGLVYTTASDAALLQASVPAMTASLAVVWLGERLNLARAAGIAISGLGVATVVLTGERVGNAPNPLLGNSIILGGVVAWSVYTIISRRLNHASQLAVTAYSTAVGTVLLFPAAAYDLVIQPPARISLDTWLKVVYMGAGAGALGYVLYNRALRSLQASQVTNFLNLLPLVAVVSSVLFLGEKLTLPQVVGGALVLSGVWLSTRGSVSAPSFRTDAEAALAPTKPTGSSPASRLNH